MRATKVIDISKESIFGNVNKRHRRKKRRHGNGKSSFQMMKNDIEVTRSAARNPGVFISLCVVRMPHFVET